MTPPVDRHPRVSNVNPITLPRSNVFEATQNLKYGLRIVGTAEA